MTTYADHAAAVTTQLIEAINAGGVGEWSAPWHHTGASVWSPINATTQRHYRGGNTLTLAIEALTKGYTSGDWATYRQFASIGAQVRKGETGTRCVRWIIKDNNDDTNGTATSDQPAGEPGEPRRAFPKIFTVFNAAQVDGYTPAVTAEPVERIEQAEHDITATGAVILHGGNRAFYRPTADVIQIPDRHRFTSTAGYLGTVFHELTHWTSAPQRCDRQLGQRFGDHAYAVEELIAELGAAMLTGRYRIANQARPDHAAYLAHWLEVLGEEPTALLSIANQAQAAVDLILSTSTHTDDANPAEANRQPVPA